MQASSRLPPHLRRTYEDCGIDADRRPDLGEVTLAMRQQGNKATRRRGIREEPIGVQGRQDQLRAPVAAWSHIHLGFSGVFGREFVVKGPVFGVDDKDCREWCISGVRALGYEKLTEQLWGPSWCCAMVLSVDARGGRSFAVAHEPHLGITKSVLMKIEA